MKLIRECSSIINDIDLSSNSIMIENLWIDEYTLRGRIMRGADVSKSGTSISL